MTLAEKLNKFDVTYTVTKGKVTLDCMPIDEQVSPDGTLVDEEQEEFIKEMENFTKEMENFETYLDLHPHGQEGGYVPYVETNGEIAWYDEYDDCEWVTCVC